MKYLDKILDIIFPKKCVNCGKRGSFLCDDCLSLIDINPFQFCLCKKPQKEIIPKCQNCSNKYLDELFSACDYNNFIIKKIIKAIREKYIQELFLPLSLLILTHLQIIKKEIEKDFILIPIQINIKEKKRKGFSESEEIAKTISSVTSLPFQNTNIQIKNKTILLIDLLYTDGIMMNEQAKILKEGGAKKVIGIVAIRG
jgi:predicted amidophosphoribosyltransferase